MKQITKVLQELVIDDKKKNTSFAMWSWVTMACFEYGSPVQSKDHGKAEIIHKDR